MTEVKGAFQDYTGTQEDGRYERLDGILGRLPKAAATASIVVGVLALAGWWLGLPLLTSAYPGLLPMKANTALGMVLAGCALWSDCEGRGGRACCAVSAVLGAAVLALGLATAGEFLTGWNFGIDQMLAREAVVFPGTAPGRMTFTAAVNFSLVGAALLFLRFEGRNFIRAVNLFAVSITAIAASNLLLYTYEFHSLYRAVQNYMPMALNTSVVFLALGLALLNARPYYPFRRILVSRSAGGITARWLLPIALLFPLVTARLVLKWHQVGYLDEGSSFALFTLLNVAGLTGLIQWNSGQLLELDRERERAAATLRKAGAELQDLYNNAPCGYHSLDKEGFFVRVNDTELSWLGYSRAELLAGKRFTDLVSPAGVEKFKKNFPLLKRLGYVKDLEFDLVRKDGTLFTALISVSAMKDASGEFVMSRATVYDISELKRSEAEIRKLNRMHTVLGEINEAIIRANDPGKLYEKACSILVEDGLFKMVWIGLLDAGGKEIKPASCRGRDDGYLESIHLSTDPSKPEGLGPTASALREKRYFINNDTENNPLMLPWRGKALERGYLSSASFPLIISGEVFGALTLYAGVTDYFKEEEVKLLTQLAADISFSAASIRNEEEKRALEAQLQQAQKMEAVGRLAGGIAHDFNNLLTAVLCYSDCLLAAMPPGDPRRSDLEDVKKAGERGAMLTRQLLAFSRRQVLQPRVLDLNPLVKDMGKMLKRLIGENIELATVLAEGLGRIKADPGQVEQVLMNLAVNARDAMPDGGRLTLQTEDVELGEDYARSHPEIAPGRYVALVVTDTGRGMGPEVQEHLFEPFFTTKEIGKGTGLGLATVYGIVKQSGGSVSVYSEPGKGTSFKVYLPRVEEAAELAAGAGKTAPDLGGRETILLVEDDEPIRRLAYRILTGKGYKVLCASCPDEALRLAETRGEAIQLMVTDVIMPHMNGHELSKLLTAAHPDMKVLYMSGYTHDIIAHQGLLEKELAFIEKPFTPEGLLEKVRATLGAGAEAGVAG